MRGGGGRMVLQDSMGGRAVILTSAGEPIDDITFNQEDDRLIAFFNWEVGTEYQLEIDTQEINVNSIVIRLPDPWERLIMGEESQSAVNRYNLWRQDPSTEYWSPISTSPDTLIHTLGKNHTFTLQGGWGNEKLRLSFIPGPNVRWIELTVGKRV